jgi:hypothetical protein
MLRCKEDLGLVVAVVVVMEPYETRVLQEKMVVMVPVQNKRKQFSPVWTPIILAFLIEGHLLWPVEDFSLVSAERTLML